MSSFKTFSKYHPSEYKFFHPKAVYLRKGDSRTFFEKDRSKIIHSSAFRRLQGKTQVFGLGGSDFFRTRLTHSLEVSQIGKGLAINLKVADPDLVELACLTHDIGHPPFGHAGESKLKELMKDFGGFEGNAQNLRIIHHLESKYADVPGLNFSRASVDSILKYNTKYSELDKSLDISKWKFYYDEDEKLVNWTKERSPSSERSIECEMMNWADDIAYSTHDLEDGIKAGMISYEKIEKMEKRVRDEINNRNLTWKDEIWNSVIKQIKELSEIKGSHHYIKVKRKEMISKLISDLITSTKVIKRKNYRNYPTRYWYTLKIPSDKKLKCEMMKCLVWEMIISDPRIATLTRKGQNLVGELFEQFVSSDEWTDKMFPLDFREKLENEQESRHRVVCDYIAGMTDSYALRMYSRLMESDIQSVFEII